MATNHTEHYGLNLWEPQDAFTHTEFNENTEKLEAALLAKADTETVETIKNSLTSKCEQTEQAVAAKVRIITGSYTGQKEANGTGTQSINLGVRPLAVLAISVSSAYGYISMATRTLTMPNGSIVITSNGFNAVAGGASSNVPHMNLKDVRYFYIAWV